MLFRLTNTMIFLLAFMSLAGGNLSILHTGIPFLYSASENLRT